MGKKKTFTSYRNSNISLFFSVPENSVRIGLYEIRRIYYNTNAIISVWDKSAKTALDDDDSHNTDGI